MLFKANQSKIFFDTCAFNPSDPDESIAANNILALEDQGVLKINVTDSVLKEINHESTPEWIKDRMLPYKDNARRKPRKDTDDNRYNRIVNTLNSQDDTESYTQDAQHLFEAYHKRCKYFVTTDKKILLNAQSFRRRLKLEVLKPSELIEII